MNPLRHQIMSYVLSSSSRLTRSDIERGMRQQFSASRKEIGHALRQLLEANELSYTNVDGHSFLEASIEKAVRITDRIILKPPNISYSAPNNEMVISIQSGVSFGSGSHPTTRMALSAIEFLLCETPFLKAGQTALDIGTGSGVLAIAAVMMGIDTAIGIDIDPCARTEAIKNVRLNQLENKIDIQNQDIEEISGQFSLIVANLRYPTLKSLYPQIAELAESDGAVIVSGIHDDEMSELADCFAPCFSCKWQRSGKNWSAMVFR